MLNITQRASGLITFFILGLAVTTGFCAEKPDSAGKPERLLVMAPEFPGIVVPQGKEVTWTSTSSTGAVPMKRPMSWWPKAQRVDGQDQDLPVHGYRRLCTRRRKEKPDL